MLGKLRGFIKYFQIGINILAINYMQCKAECKQNGDDEFTMESAICSVLAEFRLNSIYIDYITSQILIASHKVKGDIENSDFDLSFYENGFRFYSFEDDVVHDMQSKIMMCSFQTTPEKILLRFCEKAKVIGISATATVPTIIGNYDLDYLKSKMQTAFLLPSEADKTRLRSDFSNSLCGYDNVSINVGLLGGNVRDNYSASAWKIVFDSDEISEMIFDRIERELPDIKDNYHKERYIRIALAYKQFVMHNDIQSFLCVLTKHPSKMGILTTVLENFNDRFSSIAHLDFTNKASRDSTHKVIVLVDLSVNNKQVIAPIAVDFEGIYNKKIIDVNLVATYFNKNNIYDLIKEAIALENNNQVGFYYLDKKRTQSIIKHAGYQLPRILNNLSSNIIIRKIDSNVNKKINKITQSQQFVRWFGDWQNKPKTASKVVDGNGEPLVVYHQTGNDFNVFDANKKGAGEFDSEMPTGIFMKPTNSNVGLSGNKQMALYANIRNPLTVNNRAELVRFYEQNIDGYKEARDYISSIDSEYEQKYEQAEAEEDAEYSKLWTAREQGKITEDEYQKAIESNALDELEEEWHNKVNEASKEAKSLIDDYFKTSKYDGVIVKNDAGSFGRSTKTYIAFENTQVKSATDNIGTFYGENPDIRYAIDDTKSSAEKYSEDDFENKVVYPNMDERQRAQILRNERIKLSSYDSKNALSPDDVASLENSVKRNAFKILRELGTKFKVYKNYTNENIELDFDYSKSGLKESIDKQGNITTNYTDFAKMLTVFDDVIRNAVPIEVHTDKYVGTKRENPDLKYDYVLLSAFTDDNYIVPVELHIKEYKESYRINNKLYVSITLGKIKNKDNIITGSLLKNNNEVANSVPLSSEVSIPQLVSKVNEKLGNFYKYLPDELLSETQLKYKKLLQKKIDKDCQL